MILVIADDLLIKIGSHLKLGTFTEGFCRAQLALHSGIAYGVGRTAIAADLTVTLLCKFAFTADLTFQLRTRRRYTHIAPLV